MDRRQRRWAWTIYSVLAFPYLIVYFQRVAPAVVSDQVMADFQLSGAVMGNLAAIYFYIYTVMQLPAGVLADAWGPRRTITAGAAVAGLGSLLFGLAPQLAWAYLGRFLIGLGVSVIFVSLLKLIAEWFEARRFGAMSGVTMLVGNSGAILATTPLAFLVGAWGWRDSFAAIGLLTLIAAGLVWLVVRDRPEELGLAPPDPRTGGGAKVTLGEVLAGLRQVVLNPFSWPPFITYMGMYGTLMAFQGIWGVPFLIQHYGLERVQAASAMIPIALGLIVGGPLVGWVSDRMGRRKLPFALFSFIYLTGWLLLLFWPGGKVPILWLPGVFFLMGLGAAGFTIVWACAKEVNPPRLAGSAMGLVNMGGFLGGALMQPLFGWALDQKWQGAVAGGVRLYPLDAFHFAFAIATLFLMISLAALFFLKETRCRCLDENPV